MLLFYKKDQVYAHESHTVITCYLLSRQGLYRLCTILWNKLKKQKNEKVCINGKQENSQITYSFIVIAMIS